MSDYVWVIAGGIMQIPLIDECHKRDLKVFCTDGDPDCPGATRADQFVCLDTYDIYGHLDLAQSMSQSPIAVLTAGADVGPTVSAVADELSLLAVDYEVAKRVRNKLSMRETLDAPHPVFLSMEYDFATPQTYWKRFCQSKGIDPYPCVLKPLERAGSRGVSLIESPYQWATAIRKAKIAEGKWKNRQFIVEEYLQGPEVATDNFIVDGKVKFANSVWRLFSKDHFGVEMAHFNPWELNPQMRNMIKSAAKMLGVDWGPFKVDFLHDERYGWVITECATRLSGGFDHMYAAPAATGKDITKFMLDVAIGKGQNGKDLWNTKKRVACTYAPPLKEGRILGIDYPEYSWVKHVFQTKDNVAPLENCSNRPLFIITIGDDYYQAYKRAKVIGKKLEVTYEN